MDDVKIIAQIQKDHKRAGSWRKLAAWEKYAGINFVDLRDYAAGRPIVNVHHRHQLGLPALRPAPVCPVCGVVHTKRCPRRKTAWSDQPLREQPTELLRWRLENRERA